MSILYKIFQNRLAWRASLLFLILFSFQRLSADSDLTLICPDNLVVNLDACEDGFFMDYNLVNWSSTVPLSDTTYSPFQGVFLPPGNHTATIIGTDLNGNNSSCSFIVAVVQSQPNLFCNNLVQVSLAFDCFEPITPEMVLSPNTGVCEEDILLQVTTQLGDVLGVGNPVLSDVDWIGQSLVITANHLPTNLNCWSELKVNEPTVFNMLCPADITILCVESNDPQITGIPNVQTCFEQPQITLTHEDFFGQQICSNPLNYIITRSWTAENPIGEKISCQQKISSKRYQFNNVTFPPDFDGISQPAFECISGMMPSEIADTTITGIPTVNGYSAHEPSCDFSVTFTDNILNICGASNEIQRKWRVTNNCNAQIFEHTQKIVINDSQAPVFDIPDTIYVSSDADCGNEAILPSATILNECSTINFEIQTPWSTIFQNGGAATIVPLNGVHSVNYNLTDACGNLSSKTAIMIIQPGTLVSCPNNVSVDCNTYFNELEAPLLNGNSSVLSQFGNPEFYANCTPQISETFNLDVDECGIGTIQRTIQTTNFSIPQTCIQEIKVEHQSAFTVTFPEDKNIVCTGAPQNFGDPQFQTTGCEQIAVSFSDQIFTSVPNACYKIVRTWQVVNACIYNPINGNTVIESPETDFTGPNCDLNGDGNCNERTFKEGLNTTNFPNPQSDGIIEYQQVINVTDNFEPEFLPYNIDPICVEDNTCSAFVNIPMPEILDCSEVEILANGDLGQGFGPFPNVPIGTYNVTISAVDPCGNVASIQRQITVVDCQQPTASCQSNLVVNIQDTPPGSPNVTVQAQTLDDGSFDNCAEPLSFSFTSDGNTPTMNFTCDDIGLNNYFIYAIDAFGNQKICQGAIIIEDNLNLCGDPPLFFDGNIKTPSPSNDGISKTKVYFETSGGMIDSTETNDLGIYSISSLPTPFSITPERDFNVTNGVTTFDIVILQKHILVVDPITDPYKLIAADANKTGTITVSDAVAIKKIILFIDDEFQNNTSWRFVDADFVFPNPSNPFQTPFPEMINVNSTNQDNFDFIGIKIGDLNGNANPLEFQDTGDRNFKGDINFSVPNIQFKKGEIIEVPFKIDNRNIAGYQFTLAFDEQKLKYLNLINGISNHQDFGKKFAHEGYLTTSWAAQIENPNLPMFTLVFETKSDGELHNLIHLNSEYTPAEAYSTKLDFLNVKLNYETADLQNKLVVFPCQPNPFSEQTKLEFYLPEDSQVKLEIFQSNGRKIKSARNFLQKGYNALEISREDLQINGMYYFMLKTKNQHEIGKIVLID